MTILRLQASASHAFLVIHCVLSTLIELLFAFDDGFSADLDLLLYGEVIRNVERSASGENASRQAHSVLVASLQQAHRIVGSRNAATRRILRWNQLSRPVSLFLGNLVHNVYGPCHRRNALLRQVSSC